MLPAQGPQGIAPVARLGSAAQERVDVLGRARRTGGSPGQYSWRRSSSCQSPASSPTGPWWNQVLVRVGGEKCVGTGSNGVGPVAPAREVGEGLGVELLDHAEAAELALRPVPVAVVVAVLGRELAAGDLRRSPRPAPRPAPGTAAACASASRVAPRPPGRTAVEGAYCDRGHRAHVVVHLVEQVGLDPAGQIEEL